eukprot:g1264.t1
MAENKESGDAYSRRQAASAMIRSYKPTRKEAVWIRKARETMLTYSGAGALAGAVFAGGVSTMAKAPLPTRHRVMMVSLTTLFGSMVGLVASSSEWMPTLVALGDDSPLSKAARASVAAGKWGGGGRTEPDDNGSPTPTTK